MDTKTPTIPLKHQEKNHPKKYERAADVSLPPLTPFAQHRQRSKSVPVASWKYEQPCTLPAQDGLKRRPYRVLQIGATPLMYACQQGDRAKVLKLLRTQEETIGYRDRTLRNALHYCMDAATGGAVAAAAPELVNAPDAEGHAPLHLAVIAGDTQLVAILLANGADVNAKDIEGHSVLHWATVCGEAECVRLLLAADAKPSIGDLRGGTPLHYAAQCCGAATTAELTVPKKVGLKVLQSLLEFGADVNAKDEDGRQPILWAASAGSVEAVLALYRAGGSASAGASDKDGLTALHCAASRGHARCVEALVNLCGAQPDHVDDNGCSALHYAATLGHADATALLLKLGADPNRRDRKGRTPALCAAAKGQLETLKILAQHGASLHARTVRGTGIGHEAVASGRIELVKWLTKGRRGDLLLAVTQDGKSPLHVAALHGHLDICKVLLDHKARINAILTTSKGSRMTPLDAALYRGHRDCAKLIQMHGGMTAQQIKAQKIPPCKVFSAKLRLRREDSSTESDTSPRRVRKHRDPELYYEERWIERRTRRRGDVKKLSRHDSRSFSEEELQLLKEMTKRNRQRRSHSESAKYEDEMSADELLRRRSSRKRSRRRRYDSSSERSESCDDTSQLDRDEETLLRMMKRRSEDKKRKKAKQDFMREKDNDSEDVSEDSLEVTVLKKCLEKKREKVVSGRKSKTPREEKADQLNVPSGRNSRRKSSVAFKEKFDEERRREEDSEEKNESEKTEKKGQDDLENENQDMERDASREEEDITDTTSQETVEQVTVTAMIHKDQEPETPKSVGEDAKNTVDEESTTRTEKCNEEKTVKSRVDKILEKADELHTSLLTKAADLKKDMEEMRQQNAAAEKEEVQSESSSEKSELLVAKSSDDAKSPASRRSSIKEKDTESARGSISRGTTEGERRLSIVMPEEPQESTRRSSQDKDSQSKEDKDSLETVIAVTEETMETEENEEEKSKECSEQDKKENTQELEVEGNNSSATDQKKSEKGADSAKPKGKRIVKTADSRKAQSPKKSSSISASRSKPSQEKKSQSERRLSETIQKKELKTEERREVDFAKEQSFQIIDTKKHDGPSVQRAERLTIVRPSIDDSILETESSQEDTVRFSAKSKEETQSEKTESKDENNEKEGKVAMEDQKMSEQQRPGISGSENFRYIDDSSSSSPASAKTDRRSRPSTGRSKRRPSSSKQTLFESSEDQSPDRSAIIAVIESPEWEMDEEEEEEDDELVKEISEVIEEDGEHDTEQDEDDGIGVMRVLPSTSEEETPRVTTAPRPATDTLPQVEKKLSVRIVRPESSQEEGQERVRLKQRRDSGGRDSGIEPSPRVSRIPTRSMKCCPNTRKQQELHMETVQRDVQISLRRYHMERKIFFQLMELKRLQIRHGKTNEHVLVKRQVDAFNKAGLTGPTLGVVRYDKPLTFRDFEAFLYEQLRRLQKIPATSDWCTEARQCTQKTHYCHHATSAYTSVPIYTYLGGDVPERGTSLLPRIESRGRGNMTVEVTHGEEKRVIALPAEKLNPNKRYFFTFTVKGDAEEMDLVDQPKCAQRNAKSG